jgi:hypothetical protein
MTAGFRFILVAVFAAMLFGAPIRALASDSLFDPESATELTPEQRSFFGPKSAQFHYDARMVRAAQIAMERAHPEPTWRCWHYVKDALLDAGVIATRPTTAWAKDAGQELCEKFGFTKLRTTNPFHAPVGAVIVYGGRDAGHVELRTASGFVSDFVSTTPYPRKVIGIFVKPS